MFTIESIQNIKSPSKKQSICGKNQISCVIIYNRDVYTHNKLTFDVSVISLQGGYIFLDDELSINDAIQLANTVLIEDEKKEFNTWLRDYFAHIPRLIHV